MHFDVRPRRALLAALCCAGIHAAPLAAQSAPDPATLARALREANEPSPRAAAELRTRFSQSAVDVVRALGAGGYSAEETARGVVTEFRLAGAAAYYTLREAGLGGATALDVLERVGVRVPLDCIEPRGSPVPCGLFGGAIEESAHAQLKWSPHSPAWADSVLTITGSAMPQLQVLIGATVLQPITGSASQIRVRLPAGAVNGPLLVKRVADGVTGVLDSDYAVVPAPGTNWSVLAQAALSAAIDDARHWLAGAAIDSARCKVEGAVAVGTIGVLSSATGFQGRIALALTAAGAPATEAAAWDAAVREAWHEWADGATIPGLPWYPTLVAVPDSVGGPVPNVPTPLGGLISYGLPAMQKPGLQLRVAQAIGAGASGPKADAAAAFATAFSLRFNAFLLTALVNGVRGQGPVPAFAPPLVPAGMVEGGSCSGTGILPNWASF